MNLHHLVVAFFVLISLHISVKAQTLHLEKDGQKVMIISGDQTLATYWFDSLLSKPILYPVMSPSGIPITRQFPFEDVEGESHDHPHHTGVSFTYGSDHEVNGNSFWANPHDKIPIGEKPRLPQIRHIAFEDAEATPDKVKMICDLHWIGDDGIPVLLEKRIMEFVVDKDQYYIDFSIKLSPFAATVTFEDTKEGMFAIRVADWLAENANGTLYQSTGRYINAEGDQSEEGIWGKRSAWVNLQGAYAGKTVGLTIMHHPSSLNFPTYWHARGYGCFAANPIGQKAYQEGRNLEHPEERTLTLQKGEEALFKFRMLIYEGPRTKSQLDQDYEIYSN
ncbi:MAG: PmoA family protein [Saprospiraceae bacterium]|nr:PmoA family protein [Saprospiraceae bacterium]